LVRGSVDLVLIPVRNETNLSGSIQWGTISYAFIIISINVPEDEDLKKNVEKSFNLLKPYFIPYFLYGS